MSKSKNKRVLKVSNTIEKKAEKVYKTYRNIESPAFNREVTVCILRRELRSQKTQFSVGLAVRNPMDTKNEELARTIASGRAEKAPSMGYILSVDIKESRDQIQNLFDLVTLEVQQNLNLYFRGLQQVDALTTHATFSQVEFTA